MASRLRSFLQQSLLTPPGIDAHFYRAFIFVCYIGLFIHFAFIFLFWLAGTLTLALFNIVSLLLWAAALVLARRGQIIQGYTLLAIEILAHAVVSVVSL